MAVCTHPGALETVGIAAHPRIPSAAAHPCMGAGGPLSLHLRGPSFVMADAGSHGPDSMGVHDGASAFVSMMVVDSP